MRYKFMKMAKNTFFGEFQIPFSREPYATDIIKEWFIKECHFMKKVKNCV